MSGVLIDTRSLIWFARDDVRLSPAAISGLVGSASEQFVSIASIWEMAIKLGTTKLTIEFSLQQLVAEILPRQGFALMGIEAEDAMRAGSLPLHHRDPFDRMVIAQGLGRGLPIISSDRTFDLYGVTRI